LRRAFESWLQDVILPRFGVSQEEAASLKLEELENMLAESIDRWNREILEKGREEGMEEGLEKGMEKGMEKGRQAGEALMVLRLLRLKFGPLAPEIEERVRSADQDLLLTWGERVLTAERLQDVFRD
jgi:flagellar biosynthesis/type III secretory pathway protein FliH